jgi:GNAT superfamily N-acetyltransferase
MTGRQPGAAGHRIVRADPADTEALSHLIADAFFSLAPCQWLIPDAAARRDILPAYFRLYVEHAMADGHVDTTPARDGAALWIPTGAQPTAPPAGYHEYLASITGPWAQRFAHFDTELDAHHLSGTAHHHLAILAVRPGRQGHGIGTALLNAHHATLDEEHTVAYLEASGEDTRRIYLHHGYTDHGTVIQLPGVHAAHADHHRPDQIADGPRMYPMTRHPRPTANPPAAAAGHPLPREAQGHY